MKGEALCADDAGSDLESFSPERGVRGDELSFPQTEPAEAATELPIPLAELEQQLKTTVQALGWSAQQLTDFIAQRFGGRRRSQLYDYELVTVLYYLQVER
jgi:hypothetical protein